MNHSQNERERLAELYASMDEVELRELARDARALTDIAQETLRVELSKRTLDVALEYPAENADKTAHPNLVTLRQFRDIPAALLAKSILDSEGIECFLADENTIRMDWLWSNLLGGVKLWVREEDAARAAELLAQESEEGFDVDGDAEHQQPRCPQCNSANILFEELSKNVSYASVALGVPFPVKHLGWKCHACGHQWEEPGER
jgi:Putative prokaryotic signal transducing protein